MRYTTQDHETGTVIDEFNTIEEAREALGKYVQEDREEGNYTPRYYEIYDTLEQELVEYSD